MFEKLNEKYIDILEQEISRLQARDKDARNMLEDLQWAITNESNTYQLCLYCAVKEGDHHPTCRLARWLKGE